MNKNEKFEKAIMDLPKQERDILLHKLMMAHISYKKLPLSKKIKIKLQKYFSTEKNY